MNKLRYSRQAVEDLRHIRQYIAKQSGHKLIADEFVKKLRDKCGDLTTLPYMIGSLRPELQSDMRSYVFGNYVIFFRYEKNDVLKIITIVEGSRDMEALFH